MNVIWIHGFGEDSSIWESFIPKIKGKHQHFLFDFVGESGLEDMKAYSKKLKTFTILNQIQKPVIIGHSMGGYIALEYISRYSNDVSGLGLFHSTATADSEEKKAERLKTIQFIEKHGTEAFIKNFYPNMFSEDFIASNFDLVEEFTKKFSLINPEVLINSTKAMKDRKDFVEILDEFSFPAFQILGKNDPFVDFESGMMQTKHFKSPHLLLLDRIAHAGMFEAPEVCADFIGYFLKKI